MSPLTRLEIIGLYTPEHKGPFCTRDGNPVDLKIRDGRGDYPLAGYIGEGTILSSWMADGSYASHIGSVSGDDLMDAREVPVVREFWINEYRDRVHKPVLHESENAARGHSGGIGFIRTIHVREVLPGDEA